MLMSLIKYKSINLNHNLNKDIVPNQFSYLIYIFEYYTVVQVKNNVISIENINYIMYYGDNL